MDLISKAPSLYGAVKLPPVFDASASLTALVIIAVYFVIHDLRKGKGWPWVGGLRVFVLSLMTFAFSVTIYN
ncbi:hypothetical protein DOM22_09615 [Bdellovibrio sp. ZAP7]|nr:hypothetical protein DOM22_09615 [Bdellovibrio sp. ZAP7]